MTRVLVYVLAAVAVLGIAASLWLRAGTAIALAKAERAESRAVLAEDAVGYLQRTLAAERAESQRLVTIGDTHEQDRVDAEGVPAAVVADLRDGNRRLRQHWAACETRNLSAAAAATFERDAAAQRREADFGNLVRVGRDADDQLRACQSVIRAYAGASLTDGDGAPR